MTDEQVFERLAHLSGYRDALLKWADSIELTSIALYVLENNEMSSVGEQLRQSAADLRASAESVNSAIKAAVERLSDNPTTADISAALIDLTSAQETLGGAGLVADSIDPSVTAVGVTDDGHGNLLPAPTPEPTPEPAPEPAPEPDVTSDTPVDPIP